MIEAIAFDAYGTLYDVYSVERKCEEEYPASGAAMSRLWRQKQLEYSWLRTLMGRYADFWHVTEDALRYTLAELGLEGDEEKIAAIMATYLELEMYPEVIEAMARFGTRKKAILTNGNLGMIEPLVARSGLGAHLDACLSADETGLFKVRPRCTSWPWTIWASRGSVCCSCRRTAGTWPARRRSASPWAGSTAAACRPRSWACARITRRRTCWNSQRWWRPRPSATAPQAVAREVDARRRSAEPPPAKPSLAATRRLPASAQQTHRRVPRAPPRPRTRSRASCTRCRRRDGGQSR